MEKEKLDLIYEILPLLAQSEKAEEVELMNVLFCSNWKNLEIEDLRQLQITLQ